MRTSAAVSFALLGLAVALPAPQDIDFDAYEAVPVLEDIAAPVGASIVSTVSYNPTSAASAAAADATSAPGDSILRRDACASTNPGNAASVTTPADDAASFLTNAQIANIANAASSPPGYFLVDGFKNLKASASDPTYLTYVSSELTSYDPAKCAALCTAMNGCNSFNIYFERDASVIPDDVSCPNPSSVTRIKCAFFGTSLILADATNVGQWQSQFHVVIAGSNAYSTSPQPLPGWTGPTFLNNAAISAPPPGASYMGVQTFPMSQPYDPSVCAAACLKKSTYNLAHTVPVSDARLCIFFDAYILYKNGANGVFTCTYYTAVYGPPQATNKGQFNSAGDHFTIGHSYIYSLDPI